MAEYERNEKDIRFEFFPGKRRKIVLEKLTANEKDNNPNLIFGFAMPLTGQPLTGFPAFLSSGYEAVNKEGSLVYWKIFQKTMDDANSEFEDRKKHGGLYRLGNKWPSDDEQAHHSSGVQFRCPDGYTLYGKLIKPLYPGVGYPSYATETFKCFSNGNDLRRVR